MNFLDHIFDRSDLESRVVELESRIDDLESRSVDSAAFQHHVVRELETMPSERVEYTVVEVDRPATVWALVDLSEARQGDRFVIRSYVGLSDGDYALHEEYVLDHEQDRPVAQISGRFAPRTRITVAQTRGLSKSVEVEGFARYEEVDGA